MHRVFDRTGKYVYEQFSELQRRRSVAQTDDEVTMLLLYRVRGRRFVKIVRP